MRPDSRLRERCTTIAEAPRRRASLPDVATLAALTVQLQSRRGSLDEPALVVAVVEREAVTVRAALGPRPVLTVGRHGATDVWLSAGTDSLRHLLFAMTKDQMVALDLHSMNGAGLALQSVPTGRALVIAIGTAFVVACTASRGESFPWLSRQHFVEATPLHLKVFDEAGLRTLNAPTAATPSRVLGRALALASITGPVTLGRQTRNDLIIDEESVSRVHAAILPLDGQFILADVGSTNGTTIIRGARELELGVATRSSPIEVGDVIRVGDVHVDVVAHEPHDVGDDRTKVR